MKTRKLIATLIAVVLATTTVMPVSAAQVSDVDPNGSTQVTASIEDTGIVSYLITIPDTADFGTLTQPESVETAHNVYFTFKVEATDITIRKNQGVVVYMKDGSATDGQFYISQTETDDPFKIAYDVYDGKVSEENIAENSPINETATLGAYGYHLCTFMSDSEGQVQNVTLVLNQNDLYGQSLLDIAGDYSGSIVFHSALIELP